MAEPTRCNKSVSKVAPNPMACGKTVAVPALARDDVPMTVYYISPLGSFATWKSTKQVGSYDMRTFEVRLRPEGRVEGLRPGMTAIIELKIER